LIQDNDKIVDVSEAVNHRAERGAEDVIEDVIDNFSSYRPKFEQIVARQESVPLAKVKLLPPIPRPGRCMAAFSNFLDRPDRNIKEMRLDFFYKDPALVGPGGTIELPDIPAVMVYQPEAEFAFVIGKKAKNVPEDKAMDYVFGYVPFFDISARGLTRRTQFVHKGLGTFSPCGPWIATKDEIPDPLNVVVRSWLNGNKAQDFNTRDMAHKIPGQIAWLSRLLELQPGDVIATGTHHEGLCAINDGDVLEIEAEKIGKARFLVKGSGPRKDMHFIPGKTPVPQTGGKVTPV
jgi:2-keto-4-pentenoate hydratase/2-oxohepta-3-ene-1,7-dioic acid hydratase in catechol pathway